MHVRVKTDKWKAALSSSTISSLALVACEQSTQNHFLYISCTGSDSVLTVRRLLALVAVDFNLVYRTGTKYEMRVLFF